jgi:hypothetical protein
VWFGEKRDREIYKRLITEKNKLKSERKRKRMRKREGERDYPLLRELS